MSKPLMYTCYIEWDQTGSSPAITEDYYFTPEGVQKTKKLLPSQIEAMILEGRVVIPFQTKRDANKFMEAINE